MAKWSIEINDFLGGFAPAWYKETYPSYGNKNHAGNMQNADITNPGGVTQGPGLANLTNGTQAGAVLALVNSILDVAVSADKTYGIGGKYVQEISSTACTNTGSFPYAITAASGTAVGEDIALYQSNIYYTYNDTTAGEIGKYDLSTTFDDNWGSTVPTGAGALTVGVPHPLEVGVGDILYIGNGRYLASYDGTNFNTQALDLPTGWVIEDVAFNADRMWIGANYPDATGSNKNKASIFLWDGTTNQWEAEITVMGEFSSFHVKNGVLFVFYRDVSSTGGYKLAYVNGGSITDVANYLGSLPDYAQVTDYKDFIIWVSNGLIYGFGSGDKDMPVRLFQLADGGYATVGALACPFGTPMVASWDDSTNYKLAQFSGYDTACNWKSTMFDVTGDTGLSQINTVIFNFDTLATGATLDWKLVDNQGRTVYSDTISYAKATATTPLHSLTNATYRLHGKLAENFRVELDWTNGSTTNPVKVNSVKIYGTSGE